jgi:hypothetical protein
VSCMGWCTAMKAGRFATPADSPLHDCSPYRGLHARCESLGFVPRSRGRPFLSRRVIRNLLPGGVTGTVARSLFDAGSYFVLQRRTARGLNVDYARLPPPWGVKAWAVLMTLLMTPLYLLADKVRRPLGASASTSLNSLCGRCWFGRGTAAVGVQQDPSGSRAEQRGVCSDGRWQLRAAPGRLVRGAGHGGTPTMCSTLCVSLAHALSSAPLHETHRPSRVAGAQRLGADGDLACRGCAPLG